MVLEVSLCCDESAAEKLGKRGEVHAKNAVSLQNDDELLSSSNNGSTSEPTVGRILFAIENNVKQNGVFTQHKASKMQSCALAQTIHHIIQECD